MTGVLRDVTEDFKREERIKWLSGKALSAHENERKRLSREIHDSLCQDISAARLSLENLLHAAAPDLPPHLAKEGRRIASLLSHSIAGARRLIQNLRLPVLDDLGLIPAISWLAEQFRATNTGISLRLELELTDEDVPESLKIVLFRVSQELLFNIGKHASATKATLRIRMKSGKIRMSASDDGVGMIISGPESIFEKIGCFGFAGMQERLDLAGGRLSLRSRSGQGTCVSITFPLEPCDGGNMS